MAFLDIIFPDDIARGSAGGPGYDTSIASVPKTGRESRNINRQDALGKWDVIHGVKTPAQMDALIAFFRVAKGRGNTFRFRDPLDYTATAAQGTLLLLTSTTWQMLKHYVSGSATEDRLIQKPRTGTISVTGTGVYTIDYATGIITKTSGADPTAWAGSFDVPCRFDIDQMKAAVQFYNHYEWGQVPIVEVPL